MGVLGRVSPPTSTFPSTAPFRPFHFKARALALGNRGPIRFDADGRVAKEITDAYWEHGFYVLEDAVPEAELFEIRSEFEALLANARSAPLKEDVR